MSAHAAWPPGANSNPDLDQLYYVIVGMGVSALTNHLTLRAAKASRLATLPILHVGNPDPWREYARLDMGQWPALLSLPLMHHNLHSANNHEFMGSEEFVQVLEAEWRDLANAQEFFALTGKVTAVHKTSFGFELECLCGESVRRVLAARVDICGGSGPSRRLKGDVVLDQVLLDEYEDGIGRTFEWPRLMTGEMYLRKAITLAPPGSRVAVLGGGPTAAWCVERAQESGCSVLWTATESLNAAFLSSGRNDRLAQGPLTRTRKGGTYFVESELYPAGYGTRFAEGVESEKISKTDDELVRVTFRDSGRGSVGRHVNWNEERLTFPPQAEEFHQVVVALGQLKAIKEKGSWAHVLDALLGSSLNNGTHFIRDNGQRVVGLQSQDGNLRVLGASALAHPDVAAEWRDSATPSYRYWQSLVEQAKSDVGIAIVALTIAEANDVWTSTLCNKNRNTVCAKDLNSVLSSITHAADCWHDTRSVRVHPITTAELNLVLDRTVDHY
jgi:hypothetical protein